MRGRCCTCNKWEEHFYWEHLEESTFHFMKVMDGDFSQRMEFPLKFSKNFRVDLLEVVGLEDPTGQSWEIGLCKDQDCFYFKGGWRQFIEANKIERGNTLVFNYTGDSSFAVRIFDQISCVRVASDSIIDARAKGRVDRTSRSSKVRNDVLMLPEISDDGATSSRSCRDKELSVSEHRIDRRVGPSRACKQEHTDIDAVKTLQLYFAGKQGDCSFVKIIKKTNLINIPYMTIPAKFVSKHIPIKPYGFTVCNRRKKWFVRCKLTSISWGFYGKSLLNFLRENSFEQGDACVFKLREKSRKMVMEMSRIPAKEVDSILKNS